MGLRPNKAIFDTSVMAIFWVATVLPLVSLFLLSFTQGDMSLYESGYSQVSAEGLDANARVYEPEEAKTYYGGILAISIGLITLAIAFLALLERRWGRAAFEN